ncbi:MAG: IS66 family transposase [Gammaproteobacteria bacterium]|nr:IS66 family transposase [Gammaproteobacteria bacterium]
MATMDSTTQSLPDDPQAWAKLLAEQADVIEKKSEVIQAQKKRIAMLEEYLRLERHKRFGSSSEKNPNQGEIFNEAELAGCAQPEDEPPAEEQDESQPEPKQKRSGRKPLSDKLPRIQIPIDLDAAEKAGAIDTFYVVVKEELDIIPAQVRVLEYLQEKAVFAEGDQRQIKAARMPRHPIPKSLASVGLLAFVIVSKYQDGLPLYRLEGILKRYGGEVSRTTLANWMIRLSVQLQPLINLMRDEQLNGYLIQADETRIQVLKEPGLKPTSNKYMWVTVGGPPGKPSVLFAYHPSRSKAVPLELFAGYRGYLQADGYASYNAACEAQGITQLGCMDHARRYFKDAQKAQPVTKKDRPPSKADMALQMIGKLYRIERTIADRSPEEKKLYREAYSVPALNKLKQWLDQNAPKVPKDSLTGRAFTYMRNQWPRLIRYCEDGRLPISNCRAENAIRPFVIGRKSWLFADTPKGAHASALFYSLIETAKANGVDPYTYLRQVLAQLPYADTVEKLESLLPWNIKLADLPKTHPAT